MSDKSIDLVYILGTGSKWNNIELRLSLRSVEKKLTGYRNIYIVGENPGFLSQKVIHLPFPDMLSSKNADGNMALKILHACANPELSDDFLFMNDDFIINKPVNTLKFPLYHKGDMKERSDEYWKAQPYRYRLRRTFEALLERGLPTMQYDYHAPMIMNKHKFIEVMAQYDFQSDIGLTFRSLYGNTLKLPAEHLDNQKITFYRGYNLAEIRTRVVPPAFIGYNDHGLCDAFKFWLFKSFPDKSSFEKNNDVFDRMYDIMLWEKGGKKYEDGVAIYTKYFPHTNFTRLLAVHRNQGLEIKLNYRLNQVINAL